jgi:Fe-S-cluster-containing hydrogenase component 2
MSHRRDGVLEDDQARRTLPPTGRLTRGPVAIIECIENIPCNPCVDACPKGAITIEGDINDLPRVDFDRCDGCGVCISACPGLAIFVIDAGGDAETARVMLPHEFVPLPEVGEVVDALDRRGEVVGEARVARVAAARALDRTPIVTLELDTGLATTVRHFRRRPTR